MSIVGGSEPMSVLSRGTLVELGPSIVHVRLDDGAEMPDTRETVAVFVHRTKVEVVLGAVVLRDAEQRIVHIARVARAH